MLSVLISLVCSMFRTACKIFHFTLIIIVRKTVPLPIPTPGYLNRVVQPSFDTGNTLLAGQYRIGSSLVRHLARMLEGEGISTNGAQCL